MPALRAISAPVRARRYGWVGWAVLAVLLAGVVQANDDPRRPRGKRLALQDLSVALHPIAPQGQAKARVRFQEYDLIPRINFQLESITTFHGVDLPGILPEDHVLYGELSDSVRHGAERATRKAIKRYLIEASTIERRLDNLKAEIGNTRLDSKKIGFDVGFHHALPRVSMKYGVGHGWVKFRVGAKGAMGIEYKNVRMGHTEIYGGWDGDDAYELRYRLGF